MKQRGFTVIELLVVTAFLIFAGILFFVQKNNVEVAGRDNERKTAINAIYYSLEKAYYSEHSYYPSQVDETILPTVDPDLFTDPNGVKLGQTNETIGDQQVPVQSDYRYEPTNCDNDKCKSYTLRADLEKEADYVKTSLHH